MSMPDLLAMPSTFAPAQPEATVLDFVIQRRVLDRALARVGPVVSTTGLMPVLRNFHLQILEMEQPGNWAYLRISGSDSVLSAVVRVPVRSTGPAGPAAAFPAPLLQGLVREANGEDVHVTVRAKAGRHTAVLRSGKAQWTLPLMSAEGFPDFTAAEQVPTVPVNRAEFLAALNTVRRAASQDVMRPYLMMVDVRRGRMRASDSVRFHQVKFPFPLDCQIPTRAAHEVAGRLKASDLEEVGVAETESALLFKFGVVLLICQKTAAQFPDVDEVLLKPAFSNDLELIVDRDALLGAVRRVRLSADENIAAVVLSLNHGSVSVECKDRKGGFAVEEVPAEWTHAPRHIAFNHQYLTDLLASTKSDRCVFRLGKDLKTRPSALLMEDPDEGFTAVLAQIRLDWL